MVRRVQVLRLFAGEGILQILRNQRRVLLEANPAHGRTEFISELLLAMQEGIRERSKRVIDSAYKKYDDDFPIRRTHEKRFRETMDIIGGIFGADFPQLQFSATRLFYPLFCAVFHLKFGMPRLGPTRLQFKIAQYPKLKMALEQIDELIRKIKATEDEHGDIELSVEERTFYNAYKEHWVHADERTTLTQYICKQCIKALRS